MFTNSVAMIGLASLLSGVFATPIGGPGPVAIWNLTTYEGDNCDGTRIRSFQGSSSQTCDVLTGSAPVQSGPGGPILISAGSVYATTSVATYDFSFFPNEECEITGLNDQIYQVNGETCISLGDLNPESFNVTFVQGDLKARSPVQARQGSTIDTWGASSFTSTDCTGTAITNVGGSNSTTCEIIPTSQSCCPSTTGSTFTCDCIRIVTIESLQIHSDEGTHSFTLYSGDECEPTGVNNPVYEVKEGESVCVSLPEGSDGESYLVKTVD